MKRHRVAFNLPQFPSPPGRAVWREYPCEAADGLIGNGVIVEVITYWQLPITKANS
ncbi:MAG TPA: hypothetical protein V6D12_17230 [Candidatus Obscuribacterales bacterium]